LLIQQDPAAASTLDLSGVLIRGDLQTLRSQYATNPVVEKLLSRYDSQTKSAGTAQLLNTFIPGAGYLYVGQTQSAMTAFLLNGLFLWATVHFFQRGDIAAGIITASFEAGWYFGGIYGAGQEAQFYNQRIYEQVATPLMNENRLFPILMLRHAF
jgi:TM2 domain-containing membrane protein YozV